MNFQILASEKHDAKVKLGGSTVECFSPGYLKNTYPRGGCKIIGELSGGSKTDAIGSLQIDGSVHSVSAVGQHNSLLWKTAGYLQVGGDEYIAVLKSRMPLLLILLLILLALLGLLFLGGKDTPATGPGSITPERPLPTVDAGAEKLEGDTSEKPDVAPGGGSLSLIYTLEASVNLSTGDIGIYFKNPNKSTHHVALDMYIVSEGKEYLVAQSDLLEAGYGLNQLKLLENAPKLSEGLYAGLYRLHCYDPATGEEIMLTPEITGLNVTVME